MGQQREYGKSALTVKIRLNFSPAAESLSVWIPTATSSKTLTASTRAVTDIPIAAIETVAAAFSAAAIPSRSRPHPRARRSSPFRPTASAAADADWNMQQLPRPGRKRSAPRFAGTVHPRLRGGVDSSVAARSCTRPSATSSSASSQQRLLRAREAEVSSRCSAEFASKLQYENAANSASPPKRDRPRTQTRISAARSSRCSRPHERSEARFLAQDALPRCHRVLSPSPQPRRASSKAPQCRRLPKNMKLRSSNPCATVQTSLARPELRLPKDIYSAPFSRTWLAVRCLSSHTQTAGTPRADAIVVEAICSPTSTIKKKMKKKPGRPSAVLLPGPRRRPRRLTHLRTGPASSAPWDP